MSNQLSIINIRVSHPLLAEIRDLWDQTRGKLVFRHIDSHLEGISGSL